MSSTLILIVIAAYFFVLIIISYLTGKSDSNSTFFLGDKKSPWYIVAFGMLGATLSGITFISVPGKVQASAFSYMQMTLGFLLGYILIATILIPLYYRLNLTSIYGYLKERFGNSTYKTGASFFLLSRVIGASLRLYIMANVLQMAIFDDFGVPYIVTVLITVLLIWVYTFRSGIRTIIWTDTLQTLFMLIAVGMSIYLISDQMNLTFSSLVSTIKESEYSQVFFWEGKLHFWKQFLAGVFIAIVMTGLDQDMMQKNLSCRNTKDAQKNMYWFAGALVVVNLIFLSLGALLYMYAEQIGITENKDELFPMVALHGGLGITLGVFFILGLIAAAYSSADSALTSLTTSFCVDILDFEKEGNQQKQIRTRKGVHLLFSMILVGVILIIKSLNDDSVIDALFQLAGYTYGPLLGMYAFGLFTQFKVKDKWVPILAIVSPFITYYINLNSESWFNYVFSFELLILNGVIAFVGLYLLKIRIK
ncbi:MAG TPA: sodium:solute symporter [Flavobacteriales bacterium]|jgi:Na+/proline symporter|nr:sodium:solute symporter [Flavobacteriales bacterium]